MLLEGFTVANNTVGLDGDRVMGPIDDLEGVGAVGPKGLGELLCAEDMVGLMFKGVGWGAGGKTHDVEGGVGW